MFIITGGHQEDEEEVLLLGGGHEPQGGEKSEETVTCQCRKAEGSDQGEWHPLLCLWVHEGEPVPIDEGAVWPRG